MTGKEIIMGKLVIGISGGSGSGKSYFCEQLAGSLNREDVILICADHYFKRELPKMISPLTQKEYDDWNSLESVNYEDIIEDVKKALETNAKIVIIEGVTIFLCEELRNMMNLRIFIDTDVALRLYRRIKRNMKNFNMTLDEVAAYFMESARFQEEKYCLPTKIYADVIFNGAKDFDVPLRLMRSYIKEVC